jgi:hypothetical protein
MLNYLLGKIYKLTSKQTDKIFIGSSVCNLELVLINRKRDYRQHITDNKKYNYSYELVKYDDVIIELYEDFKCENKKQLTEREKEVCILLNSINKKHHEKVDLTLKGKKERDKIYKKQYYEKNKIKISLSNKKYRDKINNDNDLADWDSVSLYPSKKENKPPNKLIKGSIIKILK